MFDKNLQGKNALITGSTSGIGLVVAEALCSAGCNVMLHGFGHDEVIEAQRKGLAEQYNVTVAHQFSDLDDSHKIETLLQQTAEALGSVDILVNNAVSQFSGAVMEFPMAEWERDMTINLSAAFQLIQHVLPTMLEQRWGRILNMVLPQGEQVPVNRVAYVAANHGLLGLTRAVAQEMSDTGVTCNAICTGLSASGMENAAQGNSSSNRGGGTNFVSVDQLGQLIAFLCSDAAGSITGRTLPDDRDMETIISGA